MSEFDDGTIKVWVEYFRLLAEIEKNALNDHAALANDIELRVENPETS